jgi:hypothetical protein
MDNVEVFDSVFDALHEVKRMAGHINSTWERVFLAYNDYYERYYVTDDSDDLSSAINQRWCDSGCDSSPEDESKEWKVWEYSSAINKEKYSNTYARAKRSVIKSSIPLIRRTKTVGCEYSVAFTIE